MGNVGSKKGTNMDDYKAMMLGVYLALGWLAVPVQAVVPTPEEMTEAKEWVAAHLGPTTEVYPFSFTYGGQPSRELLKTWQVQRAVRQLDTSRTQRTITFLDPRTKLQVHCEIIEYSEYPAVEWVFSFQNQGERDTPILENIQSFDVGLPLLSKQSVHFPKDAIVHHAEGSMAQLTSFRPFNHVLGPGQRLSVESTASSWALPFYNIEWESGGIITAIGWLAAPWKAEFWRDNRPLISVRTGMRESHFLLHPKEAVRMPRILLLFWKEDRIRGHNLWRRLMLDHYSPRPGGQLVPPMLYTRGWGNWSEAQHLARINWWRQHDLPMECYWIDAGWQRAPKPEEEYEYLNNAVVREDLYPNGMKAVSAAAHAQGMKFVLWWGGGNVCYPSPSRVKKVRPELLSAEHPGTDHGNPQINRWMIDYFSRAIENWDIDIYRQDSRSVAPADRGPDRVGINWARSAAGSCTFWDALLERCPHLMIDNCCGGGQNIDLEPVRRSMALWRSDYQVGTDNDPIGMQGQTYGLSFWYP